MSFVNSENSYDRAVIFTGGYCRTSLINTEDIIPFNGKTLVIAADGGYRTANEFGIIPHILIGDMDSIDSNSLRSINGERSVETIKVNPEKDATDTMLAVETAVRRGIGEILIIGGTGGRCDHTLSNIFLLESLADRNISSALTDGENYIRILKNSYLYIKKRGYRYFSILSVNKSTVSVSGCRYPLDNALLTRSNPYAVSNEITGTYALITVSGDPAIIIESHKADF